MKKEYHYKIIGTSLIIVMILVAAFIGLIAQKDKSVISEEPLNLTEEEWQEIENVQILDVPEDICNIDEWYDDYEIVYYGDTEIKRYPNEFFVSSANEQIVEYFWHNLDKYANIVGDFNYGDCILETRTNNLYRLNTYNTENYYVYIEIEQDEENAEVGKWGGNFYVKITDSADSKPIYYVAKLVLNKEKSKDMSVYYDIEVLKVQYDEIKDIVGSFSDETNGLTNNRTYAEYVLEGLKTTISEQTNGQQTEYYHEGYNSPVDVDMMMRILGYSTE